MNQDAIGLRPGSASVSHFLAGGGEMGVRIRAHNWAATPLGPTSRWTQSLKTAVRIMLTSRQPIWIGWGDALIYLYNDPYRSIIGGRHPSALGQPTGAIWREIWHEIGPMLATARSGDEGIYVEQQLLIMERNGYPEETYYTFSYSPIPDDDGTVGGIICFNTEETQRVVSERQLKLLRDLAASTVNSRTWQDACARSASALQGNPHDLPFAMIHVTDPGTEHTTLAGLCGIDPGDAAAASAVWPLGEALRRQEIVLVSDLARFRMAFPGGAWPQPPRQVALVPIAASGEAGRAGVLVVGLNPFRLFDDGYRAFLSLAAGQIATAIANAQAYDDERRRAEALAEIDRAKTTFFSNVSHELRTPLTLMMSPLEEVLDKPERELSAESRALLRVTHRNSLRLLKLVNTLLDFSRIEAGRVQATYEPVDLAGLTAELASNFRSAMEHAGLRLVVACPALSEAVYVDRDMWEKVVLNLLSNAFKFTFDGEIAVEVMASDDGRFAEVTIRDTGTGIPAQELPRLFERFRRIEGARGRSIEGSGIGLALVQELVRLHGGSIQVESEVGRGSAFTVLLPFGMAHLPAELIGGGRAGDPAGVRAQAYVDEAVGWLADGSDAENELAAASASADISAFAPASDIAGELVLLADDNADMRRYVQRLLRSAGFQVEAVADGEAALAAMRALRPALVLSDVMMPKLDGFGLLAALRADPALHDTPVLLLSARAGEGAKVEGLASGADDYLTKPFSARELLVRVEGNLRLARIRRQTARLLKDEADTLEQINRVGTAIASEFELERAMRVVTDVATELTGARFGALFCHVVDAQGEAHTLSAFAGDAPAGVVTPCTPEMFAPSLFGKAIVRSDDVRQDPRFDGSVLSSGMTADGWPVRSYIAVPVVSRPGETLGGLFLAHPDIGAFNERSERIVANVAIKAGIAIDKARLYHSAQREIEQRRLSEAALRASEQALENKVTARTAELLAANEQLRTEAIERERAEEALRQVQKMESIGHLTGGVAHDFNNLLTVIVGNLETLQRHLKQPGQDRASLERSAEQAMRGAQRAASLTQRLLAFSRQQPLDPKPLDINRLVGGMTDLLRRTIGEQIAVETVLAGALWQVNIDPNQLEIAILNLAVNARDAMPNGGRLTIETANVQLDAAYAAAQVELDPGDYVVTAVTDNGTGMSREIVAQAFEPFFTTKDVGHGTGLGLSQVYGFVKQSGGHVKIYSELGEGTTIRIYLPRDHSDMRMIEPEAVPATPRARHGEIVLLVEDDDDVRAYSTDILRELGYAVITAGEGVSALRIVAQRPEIAILFTDVGLPGGMNGRQLAEKAQVIRPDLKVLFTSGYARDAIVHDGRLDPGVQLITKPFTLAALAAKLREVLDLHNRSGCVLVVEDEPLVQLMLLENLEELGLAGEVASSASEAVNRLRQVPGGFDAAIVDVGLPDRQGDVLAAEIRSLYPSMPIVISSGQDEMRLRARFAGDRLVVCLGKPYSMGQLQAALQSLGVVAPGART